jgi:hypothetical protein
MSLLTNIICFDPTVVRKGFLHTNIGCNATHSHSHIIRMGPCGSCKNRRFGDSASFIRVTRIGELGTTLAHLIFLRSVSRLLATTSVVPSSPTLFTLMKQALSSSEKSLLTRAFWRNIPEDPHSSEKTSFKVVMLVALRWCHVYRHGRGGAGRGRF